MSALHATDLFGQPAYRTNVGMDFTDASGVKVQVLQLVDTIDNKALASLVTHDGVEVDRITHPDYAPLVNEWVASLAPKIAA